MTAVFLAHVAATLIMVGLIWFVQVVHYPLFSQIDKDVFAAYAVAHARLTTWVVAPPMLVEALTGLLMLWRRPTEILACQVWIGVRLIAVVWLSTVLVQVPQHNSLAFGFDPAAHRVLVTSNWIRTLAWSLRGLLVLWMVPRRVR